MGVLSSRDPGAMQALLTDKWEAAATASLSNHEFRDAMSRMYQRLENIDVQPVSASSQSVASNGSKQSSPSTALPRKRFGQSDGMLGGGGLWLLSGMQAWYDKMCGAP